MITDLQELFRHLNLFGAGFLSLYALGISFLVHKRPEHVWQIRFFLALAGVEWGAYATRVDLSYVFAAFSLWETPLLYLIGPCFLGWQRGRAPGWWHWLPGVAALAAMIPYYLLPTSEKAVSLKAFFEQGTQSSYLWIYMLGGASIFLYAARVIADFRSYFRREILEAERSYVTLLIVCSMALIICALALVGVLVKNFFWVHLAAAVISAGAAWMFVNGFRHPGAQIHFQQALQQPRRNKPVLENADSKKLQAELELLMQQRQVWRDEELSLASLANELDIGVHQLSELLNRGMGVSFTQFVNDFRVAEAKVQIAKSDRPVLEIGLECGFNSKASFNRHFARVTGQSPQAWRMNLANE